MLVANDEIKSAFTWHIGFMECKKRIRSLYTHSVEGDKSLKRGIAGVE